MIKAMDVWAVAAVCYMTCIIGWKVYELRNNDRKTIKLINMNKALHPKVDVDRLYASREKRRGLLSVEECVRVEEYSLLNYLKNQTTMMTHYWTHF